MTSRSYQQAQQVAEPVSFQLNWGALAGLRWGNPQGQVILALHGWLDNAHSFLPIAQYFIDSELQSTHQLVALEWAGHGHSDHRPTGNYYPFLDYVYDMVQLCEQQQWSKVSVLAHSMGGFVANLWAGIEPERIERLLTIEAFGLLTSPESAVLDDIRQGFRSRLRQQGKRRPHYTDLNSAVLAREQAGDFSTAIAALLVERGIEQLAPNDFRFRADGQLRCRSVMRMSPQQIATILQAIRCPYTLLIGSQGHRQRLEQALSTWRTAVPQLQVMDIAGGHHAHMESPDAAWRQFCALLATENG